MISKSLQCPAHETLRNLFLGQVRDTVELDLHIRDCNSCQLYLEKISDLGQLDAVRKVVDSRYRSWDFLESPERPGDLGSIGSLLIEEEIGRGGLGVVFRAIDSQLDRPVAVKVLYNDKSGLADSRFERESKAAASVTGNNVVNVYSIGKTIDQRPFLVMPLINGLSLREKLRNGIPAFNDSAVLIRQVALGIQSVHEKGLIHRDVKPANILIEDSTKRVLITDFGLARTKSDHTLTNVNIVCGTPEYMSPEQAAGVRDLGPASDLYSLGVVLYESLTGTPPFRGRPIQILQQHQNAVAIKPSLLNSAVPRDLEVICLKAIAREPSRRYVSALSLAEDLKRFIDGRPIHARPVSHIESVTLWSKRNPRLALFASLFVLTLVVASIVSTTFWRVAAHNATLARESAYQIDIQSDKLAKTNETLLTSVETFYARVVGDQSSGMQLSGKFRNEMVAELISLYGSLLEQNPDDSKLTVRICENVCDVSDLLLEMEHFWQAADLSAWNWNAIRDFANSPDADLRLLEVSARCAFQIAHHGIGFVQSGTQFTPRFAEDTKDPKRMLAKTIELADRATELGESIEAQGIRAHAIVRGLGFYSNDREASEVLAELHEVQDVLDVLIAEHPDKIRLNEYRAIATSACQVFCENHEKPRYLDEAGQFMLRELENLKAHARPVIWARKKVAILWRNQGKALLEATKPEQAEAAFEKAIDELAAIVEETPNFVSAFGELANIYIVKGNSSWENGKLERAISHFDTAVGFFERHLKLQPKASLVFLRKLNFQFDSATRFVKANLNEKAVQYYQDVIDDYQSIFELPRLYYTKAWIVGHRDRLIVIAAEFDRMELRDKASQLRTKAREIELANPELFSK